MKSMIFPSSDRFGLRTLAPAPPRRESMQDVSLLRLGRTCSAVFVRTAAAAAMPRRQRVAVLGCIVLIGALNC